MVNRIEQFKRYYENDKGICTSKELQVLQLYRQKEVKSIAQELNLTISNIHSIFHRIRRRRDLIQKRNKAWSKLCNNKRYRNVLSPRVLPEED